MDPREQLIATIKKQGLPAHDGGPLPVVTLEQYFEGNTDVGSIGCNLSDDPGIAHFYSVLKSIRDRPEVQDVLVEIYEVEEEDAGMWPFSDRVYILTDALVDEVAKWVASLEPDEIEDGWSTGNRPPAAPVRRSRVFGVWWD